MTKDQGFLAMQVELASGDVLSGIPTVGVDVRPHAAGFAQKLTVEGTEFLAQEVRWFSLGLP